MEFPTALRTEDDGSVTIAAKVDIDRSEWGMSWALMGARLDNHVTVEARFVRRDAS